MIRTLLVAAALALAPMAAAACSEGTGKHSATNCAEGQTWDAAAQACVDTSA